MDTTFETAQPGSAPELTQLGKRLELLRIERGLSKQILARRAGISRQQLWRVMTGKSELTSALCHRLAEELGVDARMLDCDDDSASPFAATAALAEPAPMSLGDYLRSPSALRTTLRSLPAGEHGRTLKRDLLNAIEEVAVVRGIRLPPHFFTARGDVLNGEL
jgi:transcriptional regulator with XRE-family HTH domain